MSLICKLQKQGLRVTSNLERGNAVVKPTQKKSLHENNVIDDNRISVGGTIVSSTPKDRFGHVQVYLIPSHVHVPDNCPHATVSESGNVFHIATARQDAPKNNKETVLHTFYPGIVKINTPILCCEVHTSKSGPNKRDVDRDADLTPGRKVQLFGCIAYCRRNSPQQRFKASSIVFNGPKVELLKQKNEIFKALRDSKLAQQALTLMYARRTGFTSPELFKMTQQDARAVHGMVTKVLKDFKTHEISGPLGTEAILPDEAVQYMEKLVDGLQAYAVNAYKTHLERTNSEVGIWSIEQIGTYHVPLVPLFSYHELNAGVLKLSSVLELSTDEEHYNRSMEDIERMPPPTVGASVSGVAIMEKKDDGTVVTNIPYYKDAASGSCRVLHPYSIMVWLPGTIKNAFGVYSPLLGMVVAELWSRADQIFYVDDMNPVSQCHVEGRETCAAFQPALETSFGPKDSCAKWGAENVIDVHGALRKFGVRVSKEVVKTLSVDTYGSTLCGAGEQFKADYYDDKGQGKYNVPIAPPTLLTHGYWCVNGKAGLAFEALANQLPEGCTGEIEFYAIFQGCANLVEDHFFGEGEADQGPEARNTYVLQLAQANPEVAQKRIAFYAVVKPNEESASLARLPTPAEAVDVPAETVDEELEPSSKKQKLESNGDDQDADSCDDDVRVGVFGP